MNAPRIPSLALLFAAASFGAACTSSGGAGGPNADASDEADGEDGGLDASIAPNEAEAEAPVTQLRIAALSPDLPAFDVCFARHGTGDYQGPFLAGLADDAGIPADAAAPGLSYPQVSAYLPFDPGTYDVRVVPAGATSCTAAIAIATSSTEAGADGGDAAASSSAPLPDATGLTAFSAGTSTTLLVVGDATPAGADATFRVAAIQDDAVSQGAVSLRAVNAQPSAPALDFGFGSFAGAWTPLFTNVAFGSAGSKAAPGQGSADDNGYLAVAPFTSQTLSARLSANPAGDDVLTNSASLDVVGSVATLLAVGGKSGDFAHPPALVLCIDNEPSGGALADCSVLP